MEVLSWAFRSSGSVIWALLKYGVFWSCRSPLLDTRIGMIFCSLLSDLDFPSQRWWLSGKFESLAIILEPHSDEK